MLRYRRQISAEITPSPFTLPNKLLAIFSKTNHLLVSQNTKVEQTVERTSQYYFHIQPKYQSIFQYFFTVHFSNIQK
jgi:hypothetical protein